jgi:hypothetical protein
VVKILLYRRLVLENPAGDDSSSSNMKHDALTTCLGAAREISLMLQIFGKFYNQIRATFSLSYAAYISATIYLRVLARNVNDSASRESFTTCLNALDEHAKIYTAARRARAIINKSMAKIGIDPSEFNNSTASRPFDRPSQSLIVRDHMLEQTGIGMPPPIINSQHHEHIYLDASEFAGSLTNASLDAEQLHLINAQDNAWQNIFDSYDDTWRCEAGSGAYNSFFHDLYRPDV